MNDRARKPHCGKLPVAGNTLCTPCPHSPERSHKSATFVIHSKSYRVPVALGVLLCALVGCGDAASTGAVGEELADSVEAVDPALLAVLPAGSTPELLAEGRELYVVCSVCHGLDAHGTQLGPSLRDTSWVHIDGSIPQIAQITRSGIDSPEEFDIPMPPMGGGDFDDSQLQALATYVYALARTQS